MTDTLQDELTRVPDQVRRMLEQHGFDPARFLALAARARAGGVDNRVVGKVSVPGPEDVIDLPAETSSEGQQLRERGLEALANGELALCVLAGGMATRMGGVVKALVDALPGRSFLDVRLAERALATRGSRPVPLWLMTSEATDAPLRAALGDNLREGGPVATFRQHLSLRLHAGAAALFPSAEAPEVYAPGHGDLLDALKASGLLARFVENGGRTLLMANVDNLGATIDPTILGWHLAHGDPVTCEVVDKLGTDRGGIPARLDDRRVILEEFRLPTSFDPTTVRVFNTNTFHFDARALLDLDMEWTFFNVEKKRDDVLFLQFERLVGEISSHLETRFLRVPRQGPASRFLPVKDHAELEQRQGELEAALRSRGILEALDA